MCVCVCAYTNVHAYASCRRKACNDFLFRNRTSSNLHGVTHRNFALAITLVKCWSTNLLRDQILWEAPRISFEDVRPEASAWTSEILGSCGSADAWNHEWRKALRIPGFFNYSNSRGSRRILRCRVLESRNSRWTRADPRDPAGAKGSGRGSRAWPIGPELDTDQIRGPSNSLRFREAAARFGSLISFRI